MKIYAIGDLHLSGEPPTKPMEVFGEHWANHAAKVATNWRELISEEDLVLICGDTSWAMDIAEALPDLDWIATLPGKKIMLRGNHDYWWSSLKKIQIATNNHFGLLQNNFFNYGDIAICGTRGWTLPSSDSFVEADEPIFRRECIRLEASLSSATKAGYKDIIVALHYPPLFKGEDNSQLTTIMETYKVRNCVFGHIHGNDAGMVFEGEHNGINYKLVSCDTQNFMPQLIREF